MTVIIPSVLNMQDNTYETWLDGIFAMQKKETCPTTLVPADTFFLIDNSAKILGSIQIRHMLNDYLFNYGGHIGYGVRPTERRKNYAKTMLSLALKKCREKNINRILITCDKDNIASAKTIISNSGILENEVMENNTLKQRYWISF